MFNDFSDSGIEFQIETPSLVKDFFIFSVLEVFTVKHSFEDDLCAKNEDSMKCYTGVPSLGCFNLTPHKMQAENLKYWDKNKD